MTNFEKYSGTLKTTKFGLINGVPVECDKILNSFEHDPCERCRFCSDIDTDGTKSCGEFRMYWLQQEYIEPKINIPDETHIDAKVLVSTNGIDWYKRHYAGSKDGKYYAWNDGRTSFTVVDAEYSKRQKSNKRPWEYMKLYE